MGIYVDYVSEYGNITLTPYMNIDWSKQTKERGVKVSIATGWLFWEFYIDIV